MISFKQKLVVIHQQPALTLEVLADYVVLVQSAHSTDDLAKVALDFSSSFLMTLWILFSRSVAVRLHMDNMMRFWVPVSAKTGEAYIYFSIAILNVLPIMSLMDLLR